VLVGTVARAQAALAGLVAEAGAPSRRSVSAAPFLEGMMIEGGCYGMSVDECHLPSQSPAGKLSRAPFAARSDYVTAALPAAGVSAAVAAVERRQAAPALADGGLAFDAYGGAINRVPAGATAFVHRDALASIEYSANWDVAAAPDVVEANRAWLASAHAAMRPYVSGFAYQNYADPDLADWRHAYYGDNLRRLVDVRQRYDPDRLFRFPQGI
jgi:FAD/FMN-containing dehydrogenase